MLCLEIRRGPALFCRMGIQDALLFTPVVCAFVGEQFPSLSLSGMCGLPGDRRAHVYWGEDTPLVHGDALRFSLVESELPALPSRVQPTDSEEYLQGQRELEELEKDYVPGPPADRLWPDVAMALSVNGKHIATATLDGDQQHMLCTVLWDQWSPERLRVSVRTFDGGASAQDGTTEWLRDSLVIGDTFELLIAS
jgi:hypothetical protein